MKSLDEVTKALSICGRHPDCEGCPYENVFYPTEIGNTCKDIMHYDALFYLRTIETTENLYHNAVNELNKWKDEDWKDRCLPLTWDELKSMKGKPVWIEAKSLSVGVNPYWKGWYIITSFSNDEFMYCNGYEWAKEMQGRMWQAYRKERS